MYAVVYAGFAMSEYAGRRSSRGFWSYGFYFGFAESAEKALVADLAPAARRGVAFGWYTAVQGLGALAASLMFGVIWSVFGGRPLRDGQCARTRRHGPSAPRHPCSTGCWLA